MYSGRCRGFGMEGVVLMQSLLILAILYLPVLADGQGGSSVPVMRQQGSGVPTFACVTGQEYFQLNGDVGKKLWLCVSGVWEQQGGSGGGGGVPSGAILLVSSGNCPTGFTEQANLSGRTLLGTLAANLDVGGTGGNDSVTPAGTNSGVSFTPVGSNSAPTFNGNAVASTLVSAGTPSGTNSAPAFTGTASTAVVNHVHVQSVNSASNGGLSGYTADTSTNTSVASGYSTATPTGGVASYTPAGTVSAPTFTGSALGTHQHSTTATGTVSAPSFTGTQGTVPAQLFTGTAFDNRSAYVKVIFCRKD